MQNRFPQARESANSSAKLSIIHRGRNGTRTYEISAALAGSLTALAGIVAVVYMAATSYLIFKDDVLRLVMAGQARMQYAYEDRISQLRAHIDRVASHQLIEQDSVESRLSELIRRQVQLESRQALVARLTDEAAKSGVRATPAAAPVVTGSVTGFAPTTSAPATGLFRPARPTPLPEGLTERPAPQPLDELRTEKLSLRGLPIDHRTLPLLLEQAQMSSRTLANRQIAELKTLEAAARNAAQRQRTALERTGLDQTRFARLLNRPQAPAAAVGGPLVPLPGNAEAQTFEKTFVAAQAHLTEAERLSKVIRTLPLHRPLGTEYETTSGYGPRLDPFTRGMAMHTGLDFRATTGTPIRATADGKIVEAGWVGGYGRMVEIDHGFGITTRYAHMSAIEVNVGDSIRKGQVVGLVGSSGRSTGPHLHYEVRIDEEATDPRLFIRAGERAFN